MAFKAGDVVLVPFPFRDKPGEKSRPGVVVSGALYNQNGNMVISAITSHPPRDATVAEERILFLVGHLSDRDWVEVKNRVLQVFTWP